MSFKEYKFKNYIYSALRELGFIEPTEIQKVVIPRIKAGESLIGKSRTGTGKTHAFLLPLIDDLSGGGNVNVLIVTPTRELGFQLYEETLKITKHALEPVDVRLYVGGTDRKREEERLLRSQPDIAIGTIGKINELAIKANVLKIHTAKAVVFDEADMIFEADKLHETDKVLAVLDPDIQILIFSATINEGLQRFLNKYLSKLTMIDLGGPELTPPAIQHIFIPTKHKRKEALLLALLENYNPYLVLIFVNTKAKADEVSAFLASSGFRVAKLSGDLAARARKQVLRRIKEGMYQYIVATDLAARGIDITGVSHVINYELPETIDYFVHRVGRTGRADYSGTSISFYDYDDDNYLNNLKARGLRCVYKTLKKGELVDVKSPSPCPPRPQMDPIEAVHRSVPMPKKIKPGYRRKRKLEIEKQIRHLRRQKIESIYRKRNKRK